MAAICERSAYPIIRDIADRIVERFSPLRIILFGSQARGTANRYSDVDLLVVMKNGTNRWNTELAMMRATTGFPIDKTLIVTTPESIPDVTGVSAVFYALRGGVTLYGPDRSARQEARDWLLYAEEDIHFLDTKTNTTPPVACWIAHRATLNAIKAALVLENCHVPFTHDLEVLREQIPDGWGVKDIHADLAKMTRLSGDERRAVISEAGADDMECITNMARAIFGSVRDDMARRGCVA